MYKNKLIESSNLTHEFEQMIIDKFRLLLVDLAIVQNFDYNYDLINFDNRKNVKIYQFKEMYDDEYVKIINELNDSNYDGIFFKYFLINRNNDIDESNAIIEYYYDLCFKTTWSNTNYNDFILKIEKIILTFFNFNFKNINFKDFTKFNKKINYLNIDDYLYQEVYNKKNLNVINVISKYTNLNQSKIYNPKLSTTFLYWYELQNNVIPLISFDFMTNNMNENIQPFIKVRIYYTKMLMVFFNQKNINKIIE